MEGSRLPPAPPGGRRFAWLRGPAKSAKATQAPPADKVPMAAPTRDGGGRVVLSSVHPEWGSHQGDAPGPEQDAFLKQLVDHAAGRGDHAVGKTRKQVLVFAHHNSEAYKAQLKEALGRAVARPEQIHILDSPASLHTFHVGLKPKNTIIVIPGGHAVVKWEDRVGLKDRAPALRAAMDAGAGFLGICAGAYIGSTWFAESDPVQLEPAAHRRTSYLGAAPDVYALGWANAEGRMAAAAQVGVQTGLGRVPLALHDGPLLAAGAHSRVLARFDDASVAAPATDGSGLALAAATVSERLVTSR